MVALVWLQMAKNEPKYLGIRVGSGGFGQVFQICFQNGPEWSGEGPGLLFGGSNRFEPRFEPVWGRFEPRFEPAGGIIHYVLSDTDRNILKPNQRSRGDAIDPK